LQLAASHADGNGHDVEGFEPVPYRGLEERVDLIAVQGAYLFPPAPRGFYHAGSVAGYEPVVCGNDFNLGRVYATASTDEGYVIGPICPTCLEYLNERKEKGDDRASSNWP
jgi:hypothetical protein